MLNLAALSELIASRGQPKTKLSDNGTNFVGAAKEMEEKVTSWNQQEMKEKLTLGNLVWKFDPPRAPLFDGIWERLVRRCKRAMIAVLGSRSINYEILSKTMCQVEQALNARPLTSVSFDPKDLGALTPYHFPIDRPNISIRYIPEAEKYPDLREAFRTSQAYTHMIWQNWSGD